VRFLTVLCFLNHGIFAALFIWRAIVRPDAASASLERSLLVETQFLCTGLGCDSQAIVSLFIDVYRAAVGWLGLEESDAAAAMFWYMSLEGVLHVGICAGAIVLMLGNRARLFHAFLLAELLIMDVAYTVIFFAMPYYCMRHLDVCFPGGEVGEGKSFYSGLHLAGFFMTLAWLQHMSVFLDVMAYGVLVLQPTLPSGSKDSKKRR